MSVLIKYLNINLKVVKNIKPKSNYIKISSEECLRVLLNRC